MLRKALAQRVNAATLPLDEPSSKDILDYLDCDNAPIYSQKVLKRLIVLTESQGKEVDGDIIARYAELMASPATASEDGPVIYNFGDFKLSIEEDHDVFLRDGSTGYRTWEASLGAADYFLRNWKKWRVAHTNVLELGAGRGLVGLILANWGFKVTLTDGDPAIVGGLEKSVALNGVTNAQCQVLDFNDPPENLDPDFIIACDVLYDPSIFTGFLNCIKSLGVPTVISSSIRNVDSYKTFLSMAVESFEIESLATYGPGSCSEFFWFPPGPPIELVMLRPRPGLQSGGEGSSLF